MFCQQLIAAVALFLALTGTLTEAQGCEDRPFCGRWPDRCQYRGYAKLCPCTCTQRSPARSAAVVGPVKNEAQSNIEECCAAQSVKEKCRQLCTYDLTLNMLLKDRLWVDCFEEAGRIYYCSTNGYVDSSSCCKNAQVPNECGIACGKRITGECPDWGTMFLCFQDHMNTILSCQRTNYDRKRWTEGGDGEFSQCHY